MSSLDLRSGTQVIPRIFPPPPLTSRLPTSSYPCIYYQYHQYHLNISSLLHYSVCMPWPFSKVLLSLPFQIQFRPRFRVVSRLFRQNKLVCPTAEAFPHAIRSGSQLATAVSITAAHDRHKSTKSRCGSPPAELLHSDRPKVVNLKTSPAPFSSVLGHQPRSR